MKKTEFSYLSSDQQTNIHAMQWIPEDIPVGIVQLAHGMNEFINRYDDFATFLANHGYIVVGHDHLGHGESILNLDKRGYFAEPDPNMAVLQDMLTLTNLTKQKFPALPYVLFGHSMGSIFARGYVMHYPNTVKGAIFCGTLYKSDLVLNIGKVICKQSIQRHGGTYHNEKINKLMSGQLNKCFEPSSNHHDWLTRDTNVIEAYDSDEQTHFTFSLNANYAMINELLYINNPQNIQKIPCDLPLMLISGMDDPVGDFGKAVPKIVKQLKKQGLTNITSILYPEYRHELLQEINKQIVYDDILQWLSLQLEQ